MAKKEKGGIVPDAVYRAAPASADMNDADYQGEILIEQPVKEQKEAEKPVSNPPMPILLDARGVIKAKDNSELARYSNMLLVNSGAPKGLDTMGKVMMALTFVRQLGFPDYAIRQVANIHGTTSIFGDLPLAAAQRTKEVTGLKEQWFDKSYNVISFENKNLDAEAHGAVCFMGRAKGEVQSFAFTLDDAKKAGLYPEANTNKPWHKYTKMMLRYRARSIALKSLFADALSGIAIAEYDFNSLPSHEDMREVNTSVGTMASADDINKEFGGTAAGDKGDDESFD